MQLLHSKQLYVLIPSLITNCRRFQFKILLVKWNRKPKIWSENSSQQNRSLYFFLTLNFDSQNNDKFTILEISMLTLFVELDMKSWTVQIHNSWDFFAYSIKFRKKFLKILKIFKKKNFCLHFEKTKENISTSLNLSLNFTQLNRFSNVLL